MTVQEIETIFRLAGCAAVQLVHTGRRTSQSKLGGLPNVPAGFVWPTWKDRPLAFLAQLDLAALPHPENLPLLPADGMLYFFHEQDHRTDGCSPEHAGSWRVIHAPSGSFLQEAQLPHGLEEESIYAEKALGFHDILSYPSAERLGINLRKIRNDAFDTEQELRSATLAEGPAHQFGGYADPLRMDRMELEAQLVSRGVDCTDGIGFSDPQARELAFGAADWQLLLQLDSDDDAGMMWGHYGRLYFWIRRQDLSTGDFSKVWMLRQQS